MNEYTLNERRERVHKYFIEIPEKPDNSIWTILITGFALLIIKGCLFAEITSLFFVPVGLLGLYLIIRRFYQSRRGYKMAVSKAVPRASDQEMDAWLGEGSRLVFEKARQRLGIEEDDINAEVLQIGGPGTKADIMPGTDGRLRFNPHGFLLLFLTDHNIATYRCTFDIGTGKILEDSTREVPYRDITDLETKHTDADNMGAWARDAEGLQTMNIHTSGGNVLSVDYISSLHTGTEYPAHPSGAENAIRALRKRIKEYKDQYSANAG